MAFKEGDVEAPRENGLGKHSSDVQIQGFFQNILIIKIQYLTMNVFFLDTNILTPLGKF